MASKFRWTADMVAALIKAIKQYKTEMEFKNLDFNADKQKQYEEVRLILAKDYDVCYFGVHHSKHEAGLTEKDIDSIKVGHKRIMEKTKELRQKFSHSVTTGSRSGSGKLVMEFYDDLKTIWGGSASTNPLPFGIDNHDHEKSNHPVDNVTDDYDDTSDASLTFSDSRNVSTDQDLTHDLITSPEPECEVASENIDRSKKKRKNDAVIKLIDNKRKNLEKGLSARERDNILLRESKEESLFRKELCDTLRESNAAFANAVNSMGSAMTSIAQCMNQTL